MYIDRVKSNIVGRLNNAILENRAEDFRIALEDLGDLIDKEIVANAVGFAAMSKDVGAAKALLDALPEFDIDTKNGAGFTPLMLAASYNSREMVDLFISYGAEITDKNNKGETALDLATKNKEELGKEYYRTEYSDEIIDCLEILNGIKKVEIKRKDSKLNQNKNRSF